jgi:hypothetical protein
MLTRTSFYMGLVLVAACGGASGSETLIGAPCESADECDVTGVCVTDGRDGICTQTCMRAGYPGECPLGSYCTSGAFTSAASDETVTRTLCFPACKQQSDCREGYQCNDVSSGPGMVCTP